MFLFVDLNADLNESGSKMIRDTIYFTSSTQFRKKTYIQTEDARTVSRTVNVRYLPSKLDNKFNSNTHKSHTHDKHKEIKLTDGHTKLKQFTLHKWRLRQSLTTFDNFISLCL